MSLELQGTQGEEAEEEEVRFATGSGLTGLALSTSEIVVRNNPEAGDPNFNPDIDRYSSLRTVTMMVGTIMSTEDPSKPIGVIQVRIVSFYDFLICSLCTCFTAVHVLTDAWQSALIKVHIGFPTLQ